MQQVDSNAEDRRANTFCLRVWSGTGVCVCVCVLVCVCVCGMGSDSSQLVPKTGRHEAFHLVCEETQGCKECAEELKGRKGRMSLQLKVNKTSSHQFLDKVEA